MALSIRMSCALALALALLSGCGDGSDAERAPPRVVLPKGPIEGHFVGEEIWISYGAEEGVPAERRTGRTREEAKQIAEDLYERAESGEDVGELAREYSNAPGGAAFGFSSVLPKDAENPDLRDRWMAAVEIGELTDLIEWRRGFWFARRITIERGAQLETLFERFQRLRVSVRVIALLYKGAWIPDKMFVPRYTKDEAVRFAGELLMRAKTGESFESLAKVYSEDSSAEDGGLVTIVRRDGKRDKWLHIAEPGVSHKILRAAFSAKPGTIHPEVIVSPRGVFVLKVDAHKEMER